MYPNLYYIFREWFNIKLEGLKFINSFGFFVALAFITAAIVLTAELRRKGKQGLLNYEESKVTVGKPASIGELLINFLIGFVFGFKFLGALVSDTPVTTDPQAYIFSSEGSVPAGILLGLVLAGIKWYEKNKQKLSKPEERTIRIWPHDRVGDMVIFAAVFGFAGAKLFDNFENWDRFIKDPIGNLFSASGLTFYGGLICAALAIWWYAKRHKIGFWHLNDAAAPALMLAYAIGRVGCQVSGDGDWGIINSAYQSDALGNLSLATQQDFSAALQLHNSYYLKGTITDLAQVQHVSFKGVSWLPDWFFAYSYPHNVNGDGIQMAVNNWDQFNYMLPIPVFPTPLYEFITCTILFVVIWLLRKQFKVAGTLFGFYLLVNGLERFFIEKIRVNTKYEHLPFQPTQAEIISFFLIITGAFLMIYLPKKARKG